jgi:NAD(P)-dependent dehydrogenase (short-subunit alcohol dehydrogenase family)
MAASAAGRRVLITGASSGVGAALARAIANQGDSGAVKVAIDQR